MPPFRNGLLKRKAGSEEAKQNASVKASDESQDGSEDEELLTGELDTAGDETDSEHEDEAGAASDHEQDEVLFRDSGDSTFGDDDQADIASEASSDLTDSEADDESEEDDEDDSDKQESSDDDEDSVDSGAESGVTHTHSGASDSETEKPAKQTKHKASKDTKQTPVKEIKPKTKALNQDKTKSKTDASIDRLADTIQEASGNIQPVGQKDEYESGDTSDEEDRRNTVGDVPMWWYNEYPHVGYDLDARRLVRPPQRDQIDEFLRKCEDPDFWRTVRDPSTGQDVVLSKQDLELIHRLREGHVPDAAHDDYQPWVEWFSRSVLATPLRAFPEHKRSFLPSRSEQQRVARIVHALKMGWTKTRKQIADERRKKREKNFYNLWGSATSEEEARQRGIHKHIPAPRRALPSHAESYNPPPEYLLDAKELKEWNKLSETPWKRKYTFLPTRHASLRAVPSYERFARERFLRCLDLYLAPRAIKMRLTIGPDDLVPKLPAPRDLRPFPTGEALRMRGHAGLVRSADFDPSGQYIVSGGDDGTVRVWETASGRCLRTIALEGAVTRVAWGPTAGLSLVAAAVGPRLLLLNPGADIGALRVAARTDRLLEEPPPQHDVQVDARTAACAAWERVAAPQWARGERLRVTHFRPVASVAWHARGDYVCVTLREAASRAVLVHQLSRRRSQLPFARSKGLVQCALFHPSRPLLFVAVSARPLRRWPRPARASHCLPPTDAACSARVRPGEAGAGPQAADGRAVGEPHGRASRRRQLAGGLVRQEVHVVRPGAIVEAIPDAAPARRRSARRGLPSALPAVRVRRRRRQHRRIARHGLQRPAAESAAGAAQAAASRRARRAAVRAGAALASRAALAAGRVRRRHAASLHIAALASRAALAAGRVRRRHAASLHIAALASRAALAAGRVRRRHAASLHIAALASRAALAAGRVRRRHAASLHIAALASRAALAAGRVRRRHAASLHIAALASRAALAAGRVRRRHAASLHIAALASRAALAAGRVRRRHAASLHIAALASRAALAAGRVRRRHAASLHIAALASRAALAAGRVRRRHAASLHIAALASRAALAAGRVRRRHAASLHIAALASRAALAAGRVRRRHAASLHIAALASRAALAAGRVRRRHAASLHIAALASRAALAAGRVRRRHAASLHIAALASRAALAAGRVRRRHAASLHMSCPILKQLHYSTDALLF